MNVLDALVLEFADLSAAQAARLGVRLLTAGVIGGLYGWDRTRAGKSAGIRTYALVAIGTAAFVAVPDLTGAGTDAVSRVIQGLAAGIGFLGAGCIQKTGEDGQVRGLTTAAGVWLTAAVGVTAGTGHLSAALLLGAFGWFTLAILHRYERTATGALE